MFFLILFSLYMLMHIIMLFWLYKVPLARRREMKEKSFQYKRKIHQQTNDEQLINEYYINDLSNKTKNNNKYAISQVNL